MKTNPNQKLADHLEQIGTLLAMGGESRFKVVTFENAAEHVRKLDHTVRSPDELRGVKGIGDSVREVVSEFVASGTSGRLGDLVRTVAPLSVLTMTAVRGIGPKKAMALYRQGFESLDHLANAAQCGKLAEDLTREVLIALDVVKHGRWALGDAESAAYVVSEKLGAIRGLMNPAPCGSLRRKRPTVGDLDFVGWAADGADVARMLRSFRDFAEAEGGHGLTSGENRASTRWVLFGRPIQADLWIVSETSYGAALAYATGSRAHNIELRAKAQKQKLVLNEYGLWRGKKQIAGATEESIYQALGVPFVEPTAREVVS